MTGSDEKCSDAEKMLRRTVAKAASVRDVRPSGSNEPATFVADALGEFRIVDGHAGRIGLLISVDGETHLWSHPNPAAAMLSPAVMAHRLVGRLAGLHGLAMTSQESEVPPGVPIPTLIRVGEGPVTELLDVIQMDLDPLVRTRMILSPRSPGADLRVTLIEPNMTERPVLDLGEAAEACASMPIALDVRAGTEKGRTTFVHGSRLIRHTAPADALSQMRAQSRIVEALQKRNA